MHVILIFFCIPILLLCPILYPPLATFTAIFFLRINKWYVSLGLIFSSAIVSSLISATIIPIHDTEIYLDSFIKINHFDFTQLNLDNDGFEPFYKVYEYILSIFIGDNQKFFLLVTALIFNILSTLAILRICLRLNQRELSCIIFAIYYSLAPPALGVSLFLLRSSLSFSIILLAISYYKEKHILFYLLGLVAIFIHYFSLIFLIAMIFQDALTFFNDKIQNVLKVKDFMLSINVFLLRLSLVIFIVSCFLLIAAPNLLISISQAFVSGLSDSGSGKAEALLGTKEDNFVDFTNPVFLIQAILSFLCFLKIQDSLVNKSITNKIDNKKIFGLLKILRLIGRFQIIVILLTGPFGLLPYRLGLFNFLYFPLWLINIPYLSFMHIRWRKYSDYLVLFALVSVLAYTFYWMPKRQNMEFDIESTSNVLQGKPLSYNIAQVIDYFCN